MSENNSTRKMDIEFFDKPDGSRWIRVLLLKYGLPRPSLVPSLLDLHRILQALAVCEDEKYPPPAKGRTFLVEFLQDAVREPDWSVLARKYKIPDRDGDRVVNSNGAALGPTASHPLLPLSRPLTADDIPWGLK